MIKTTLKSRQQLRTTADKRLRYTSPKLPSATSFIRKTIMDPYSEKALSGFVEELKNRTEEEKEHLHKEP